MPELTPQQVAFVEEFLVDLNATQAAVRAGYSRKSAQVTGSRLLSNAMVQEAIAFAKFERSQRTKVTQDEVLQRLWNIAKGDARRVMSWGPGGLILKDSSDLDYDDACLVAEASQSVTQHGGSIRLKMHDARAAAVDVGKHLGMFTDKIEHILPDAAVFEIAGKAAADAGLSEEQAESLMDRIAEGIKARAGR